MEQLTFNDDLLNRSPPRGIDVETTLAHFAIITCLIEPALIRPLIHPRFELDLVEVDGQERALLSVVPFMDQDFRFVRFPWRKWRFGQTNYRVYVTDTQTGEHAAWFIGTSLDSWTVSIPHHLWKLPWHRANIDFDCTYDIAAKRYTKYRMQTTDSWADAEVELTDTGRPPTELTGFDDLETGLVILTHPRTGFYHRRDGQLGSYQIWHDRLQTTVGQVTTARFALLEQRGLIPAGTEPQIHSVLMQHETEFTIYLPPRVVGDGSDKV
ncbi:hypothetical protein Pan153_10020 [Gimesia panareensis]|uniref:DUF2071 domain-containing protein n=1 Tax=Gimesia panareensis TaxID=2527978 RepID=A0A518FJ46_9PLAN|nr:DUF2071 domain-containing protein [Gimesia panareensis]QDV16375.1 hypothetical protein Pan153_10020 [Gimesia panareensis]